MHDFFCLFCFRTYAALDYFFLVKCYGFFCLIAILLKLYLNHIDFSVFFFFLTMKLLFFVRTKLFFFNTTLVCPSSFPGTRDLDEGRPDKRGRLHAGVGDNVQGQIVCRSLVASSKSHLSVGRVEFEILYHQAGTAADDLGRERRQGTVFDGHDGQVLAEGQLVGELHEGRVVVDVE